MTVIRHYLMAAAEGRADELAGALRTLAGAVEAIAGCEGTETMRDLDRPGRFLFIERWVSVEAHKAGGANLLKPLLEALMAPLAGQPEGAYFQPL